MGIARNDIEENINNPEMLEKLYQKDKKYFEEVIEKMCNEEIDNFAIKFWYARLFFKDEISSRRKSFLQYVIVVFLIVFSWVPLKLFTLDSIFNKDIILRIIPITFSLALSIYFHIKAFNIKHVIKSLLLYVSITLYFISIPVNNISQSNTNAFYFGLIILWFFVWFSYSSFKIDNINLFSDFVQSTAETIIWSTLCMLGGMILVLLSINLFETIGINANKFYINNIATLGLCAAPFISLIVIEIFTKVKLSVILSNIFLPLFLVSLVIFGIVSFFTNVKPYETRNVFIIYKIMLVIVICLLVFTKINNQNSRFIYICSNILTVLTIILDVIVLSAIIYRINNYGITPNKITLLLSNIVMLGNLIYIIYLSIKYRKCKNNFKNVIYYLPMYAILAFVIVFIFPIIFKFR